MSEVGLFEGAAGHYARYRSEYPPEVFDRLAERLGLRGDERALDLGCGPGMATFPLARRVAEVVAVDPDRAMLAAGRDLATTRGVSNIQWVNGDSGSLDTLELGAPDLATMAASFHWMDRPATLAALDRVLRPGAAVVVISGSMSGTAPDVPDRPRWADAVVETRRRWVPFRRRWLGDTTNDQRTYGEVRREHHTIVRGSPFGATQAFEVRWSREHDLDSLVGLQLTIPGTSPGQLGDRLDGFVDDLRRTLSAVEPSGVFVEPIRTDVLIGRRPR